MPAKQRENWSEYFSKLNKTLNNFEQRLERVETQVTSLSRKPTAVSAPEETEIAYQSHPRRRLGWGLVWLFVFLFFGRYLLGGIFGFLPIPYLILSPLTWISLIAGIVLILSNESI